jgi:Bacterial Ig-like domain
MRHIHLHRLHRQTSWFTAWSLAALVVMVGCSSSPTGPEDIVAPTVSSTNPQNGATGAAVITASFSEAMNASTITAATFTVSGPGLAQVAGTVAYSASTEMARFTPISVLAPNTVYTATITTGAQDVVGNALVSNHVWSFTTSTTTDNQALIGRPLLPPAMPS